MAVHKIRGEMKSIKKSQEMTKEELASYIDHSVLKPEFTQDELGKYIQEGIAFACKTVCINPSSLDIAKNLCSGTSTGICVVCDFPFGLSSTKSKVMQAEEICKNNDIEDLDIVANYGWIRSGLWEQVEAEIQAVADSVHEHGSILKVIFETDVLTLGEIEKATEIACAAGSDFVKTSTGFFTGGESKGATMEVIKCMIEASRGRCKVKGSGGIREQKHFFDLIDVGIDRMGIGYKSTAIVLGSSQETSHQGIEEY